ncbi:hypothetical protein GIB67_032226, partial [Kingdonia uniflora]
HQIEAPAIGAAPTIGATPAIGASAVGAPAVGALAVAEPVIGSSSFATEIRAVVIRVCSQLEKHDKMLLKLDDHDKMLHNHGKMLEQISISIVGDNTLPLGDTPLLGQYQFSTPKKIVKCKREGGNEKEDRKMKKAEPRKKKILKKGLANRVSRKTWVEFPELQNIQSTSKNLLQQVVHGEILEVVNDLMVGDDVEVGSEVNFNAISSEYGGDLLEYILAFVRLSLSFSFPKLLFLLKSLFILFVVYEVKKGDEKYNDDKKDVKEKVKSEEEEVLEIEESKNGDEKVDDVTEEEDSKQPTVVVYYNGKKDVQHDNEASADQTTVISVEEQTLEDEKTKDEASQASVDQTTVVSVEEQTPEDEKTKDEASQLILIESEVDVTLKKRYALTEEEINKRVVKIACEMNRLHAHLDELLPGVLLESFIQRPISQDEKNQVNQVWSLRKDGLSPEAKKDNSSTYMRIGH